MDPHSQVDRRRARLALVLLVLALCERATDPGSDPQAELVLQARVAELATGP
jgi:hypothetical protein